VIRKTTVVVGDRHPIYRAGLRHILENKLGLHVVAEASDLPTMVQEAQNRRPDLVIADHSLAADGGTGLIELLRRSVAQVRVLILGGKPDGGRAILADTNGYITKETTVVEFCAAVAALVPHANNGRVVSTQGSSNSLTARETQVLCEIAHGSTSKETARRLGISHRTVETHRTSVMRKLGISSVAGLTRFAIENGLID
jgi:DNA-binding NarL/FixJ family response regulator